MGRHQDPALAERAARMVSMHKQGITLVKIGSQFGLTRERVRQILKKQGFTARTGGQSLTAQVKAEQKARAMEARYLAKYGQPKAVMDVLRSQGVTRAYQEQQRNARTRGVSWQLDFASWFAIWQASGKLHLRGRNKGQYVMSRIRDDGPYAMGNVHIQLCSDNGREAVAKWRGKVKENRGVFCLYPGRAKAWMAQVQGVSIGFFETEAGAVEARKAELSRRGLSEITGLGRGKGWYFRPGARHAKHPYVMQCAGVKAKCFATQAEAEAAYKAAVAERIAAIQQVSEPA